MNLHCPHCNHEIDDPDECYKTDVKYDYECDECEKTFYFFVEYVRHYTSLLGFENT